MNTLNQDNIQGRIRAGVDLSKSNWFNVGGKAKFLFKPKDNNDLSLFLKNNSKEFSILPLGVGSNVIIREGGFDGVIVKLGREFTKIDIDKNEVTIGAGCLDYNSAHFLADHGLSGLEFYVGIPGSIGGAIAMNAGAYQKDTSEFLIDCAAVRISDGKIFTLSNKDMGYVYRGNSLTEKFIFTQARYKLHTDAPEKILKRMSDISQKRENTQPIRSKTGGSTFKNPPGQKAWELIDSSGLRGFSVGDAEMSEKHCNFMVNKGGTTAADLENLGDHVIKIVYQKTGVRLEWEIKRIGQF